MLTIVEMAIRWTFAMRWTHLVMSHKKYENEIRMEVPVITLDAFSESYFMI